LFQGKIEKCLDFYKRRDATAERSLLIKKQIEDTAKERYNRGDVDDEEHTPKKQKTSNSSQLRRMSTCTTATTGTETAVNTLMHLSEGTQMEKNPMDSDEEEQEDDDDSGKKSDNESETDDEKVASLKHKTTDGEDHFDDDSDVDSVKKNKPTADESDDEDDSSEDESENVDRNETPLKRKTSSMFEGDGYDDSVELHKTTEDDPNNINSQPVTRVSPRLTKRKKKNYAEN
jgi:hypothetical protein